MKLSYWLIIIGLGMFSTSCVSNYVVSSNSFNPNVNTPKEHFTPNGIEIPKANLAVQNRFRVHEPVEQIELSRTTLNEISDQEITTQITNNIPYTAYSILEDAKTYLGTPYRYGGTSKRYGIDCSAFTQQVFGSNNISLPRVARLQAKEGQYVNKSDLRKGDLLFFITRGRYISHVGIVESVEPNGEIKFIHASSSAGVTVSSLSNSYWANRFQFAKRVI